MDLQFFDRRDSRVALSAMQVAMDVFESSGWANTLAYQNVSILIQVPNTNPKYLILNANP
jgi:hypothetical protein